MRIFKCITSQSLNKLLIQKRSSNYTLYHAIYIFVLLGNRNVIYSLFGGYVTVYVWLLGIFMNGLHDAPFFFVLYVSGTKNEKKKQTWQQKVNLFAGEFMPKI